MLNTYQVQIHFQNGGQLTYNRLIAEDPQGWLADMLEDVDTHLDSDVNGRVISVNLDHVTAILVQKVQEEESKDEEINRDI